MNRKRLHQTVLLLCTALPWPVLAETFRLDATKLTEMPAPPSTGSHGGVIGGGSTHGTKQESPLRITSFEAKPQPILLGLPVELDIVMENTSTGLTVDFPATRDRTLERKWGKALLLTVNTTLRFTKGGLRGDSLYGFTLYGVREDTSTVIRLKPGDRLEFKVAMPASFVRPGAYTAVPFDGAPLPNTAQIEVHLRSGPRFQPLVKSTEFGTSLQRQKGSNARE